MKNKPNYFDDKIKNKNIIFYDGICVFCSRSIYFILKHDKSNAFLICPFQTEFWKQLCDQYEINKKSIDTVVLLDQSNRIFVKSKAVIKVMIILGFPFNLFGIFKVFPSVWLDKLYDFIARNRYKWFGKNKNCRIIKQDFKSKFI